MIIVGYQGIGKSTLAGKQGCIDLESGSFWDRGVRPDDWYIYYCNIAEHLSQQGYTVFVSSHEVVRTRLLNSDENVVAIFPDASLKLEWTNKLYQRYLRSGLDKDYKAWANAADRYEANIFELQNSGLKYVRIEDMNYSLPDIVDRLQVIHCESSEA